jgi:hypothetical protein
MVIKNMLSVRLKYFKGTMSLRLKSFKHAKHVLKLLRAS